MLLTTLNKNQFEAFLTECEWFSFVYRQGVLVSVDYPSVRIAGFHSKLLAFIQRYYHATKVTSPTFTIRYMRKESGYTIYYECIEQNNAGFFLVNSSEIGARVKYIDSFTMQYTTADQAKSPEDAKKEQEHLPEFIRDARRILESAKCFLQS